MIDQLIRFLTTSKRRESNKQLALFLQRSEYKYESLDYVLSQLEKGKLT